MNNKLCKDCDAHPVVVDTRGKSRGRCNACLKAYNRADMAARRLRRKQALLSKNDESTGWKVCSKCLTQKRLSEYSTNRRDGKGRTNKICDTCLTAVYMSNSRRSAGFDEVWWRKRAYTCNTAYRNHVAKQTAVKVASVKTADLDYVCKPQDIARVFAKQKGKCHYCSVNLYPSNTSVDHATPLCRGGAHNPANFRIACSDCNHLKWKRNEIEFTAFIRGYVGRFK